MSGEVQEVEGSTYRVLAVVAEHTLVSRNRLKQTCAASFPTDELFEAALEHLLGAGLCKPIGDQSVRVTPTGLEWLREHSEVLDVEDEDTSSSENTPRRPYEAEKLKMESRPLSVFQALRKIDKGEIDLHPDFQRAFVWDEEKQSRLIESLLMRIPLPAFYLDATDEVKWSVVDGLQRLTTLHRFCNQKAFKLTGLEFLPELEGVGFDDLPKAYKVLLEDDTSLLFYNLLPGTPTEAKFTIFSRVNTGGMKLTAQEIRHALNPGPVTAFLAELSREEVFLRATSGAVESLRMSDRELVLRGLAFLAFGVETYREFGELDGFLLHAMKELNGFSETDREELRNRFLSSLDKVHAVFGRYSFRKFYELNGRPGPLNKALFEVFVRGIERFDKDALLAKEDEITESFITLLLIDDDFVKSISASTGGISAVQTRFEKAEELFSDALRG